MRRWVCPECGSGVNAPERPRRNDVRRFCLSCSGRVGVLVERSCPALEKRRVAAADKRRARAARQSEMRRERRVARTERARARYIVAGIDVRKLVRQCWHALAGCGEGPELRWPEPPTIRVSQAHRIKYGGHAFPQRNHVSVKFHANADAAIVREVVLHEVTHCVLGDDERHGPTFNAMLCGAARKLWGFDEVSGGEGYGPSRTLRAWLRKRDKCRADGGHYADNQGRCHNCGIWMKDADHD